VSCSQPCPSTVGLILRNLVHSTVYDGLAFVLRKFSYAGFRRHSGSWIVKVKCDCCTPLKGGATYLIETRIFEEFSGRGQFYYHINPILLTWCIFECGWWVSVNFVYVCIENVQINV